MTRRLRLLAPLALGLLAVAPAARAAMEPGTAGYDGGFVIQSADGQSKLKLGGHLQVRHELTKMEDVNAESELVLPRARLKAGGTALARELGFYLQLDFSKGKAGLKDYWLDYAVSKAVHVRAGQWKMPLSRQLITSASKLDQVDRAITNGAFRLGRDVGVALHNDYERSPEVEWAVAVINGTGEGVVPGTFHPAVLARVGYNTGGISGYSEGDLEGGPLRVGVAASVRADFDADGGDDGGVLVGVDAILKASGVAATAAVYLETDQDGGGFGDQTLARTGFHAQVSYTIADRVLPALRYARVMPDGDDNDMDELTVGVSGLLFGHKAKLTVDASRLGMEAPTGDTTEWRLRTQAQIAF